MSSNDDIINIKGSILRTRTKPKWLIMLTMLFTDPGNSHKKDFRNDKLYFKNLTKPIQFSCQLLT